MRAHPLCHQTEGFVTGISRDAKLKMVILKVHLPFVHYNLAIADSNCVQATLLVRNDRPCLPSCVLSATALVLFAFLVIAAGSASLQASISDVPQNCSLAMSHESGALHFEETLP